MLAAATQTWLNARLNLLQLDSQQVTSIRPCSDVKPQSVKALPQVRGELPETSPETQPLCHAVQQAAPHMHWRQTYSTADGFAQSFLDNYGWFDLAGPDGPYTADGLRIMFGYWGQGLYYPDHSHGQEEHYVVLAGAAWFRLEDQPFRRLGPGQIFHTPPGRVHAAEMRDAPLLAMAIWRAQDLTVRVHLTDSDHQVEAG